MNYEDTDFTSFETPVRDHEDLTIDDFRRGKWFNEKQQWLFENNPWLLDFCATFESWADIH